jgi:deferrochelatase/peroxidase EfeB
MGFEDGNGNPKSDKQRVFSFSKEINKSSLGIYLGECCSDQWNQLNQNEQETIIGRTKGENSLKVKPTANNSHLVRTDLKDENKIDLKVVRQSLLSGGMNEHGLFFIFYASNPLKHDK